MVLGHENKHLAVKSAYVIFYPNGGDHITVLAAYFINEDYYLSKHCCKWGMTGLGPSDIGPNRSFLNSQAYIRVVLEL